MKTEAKKLVEHLSLLPILGTQGSHFLLRGPIVSLVFFFITDIPIEAFFIALDVPDQLNSITALAFLT